MSYLWFFTIASTKWERSWDLLQYIERVVHHWICLSTQCPKFDSDDDPFCLYLTIVTIKFDIAQSLRFQELVVPVWAPITCFFCFWDSFHTIDYLHHSDLHNTNTSPFFSTPHKTHFCDISLNSRVLTEYPKLH